jgi:hypothetical protein
LEDYDENYYPENEILKKNNMKPIKVRKRIVYHAKWVVGEEIIFDHGKMHNQARPNKTRPLLPLYVYLHEYKSITARLSPVMNELQIASLKYQNSMSTATSGGWAIDVAMMDNIVDGEKKYSIPDILRMWQERRVILHQTSVNGVYQGGATVPIQYIPGDIKEEIETYVTIMQNCMKQVEDLTGLSPIALGAAPTADQAVRTTEMAYQSTMNSLKHIVDGCRYIKQMLGTSTAERVRLVMNVDKKVQKAYTSVIGEKGVERILDAKKRQVQYGMKLVARATDLEKQMLLKSVEDSYANKAQGGVGISLGQKLQLVQLMESGSNLKDIARKLRYWEKKEEKRLQEEKERNIQLQGEQLKEQEQIKAQNAQRIQEMTTKAQIAIDNNKGKMELQQIVVKEQEQRKTERIKANAALVKTLTEQETKEKELEYEAIYGEREIKDTS